MRDHTPGPWKRSELGTGNDIVSEATYSVGPIATAFRRNDSREQEANASLISAAPELYEACKALLNCYERNDYTECVMRISHAVDKAERRERKAS